MRPCMRKCGSPYSRASPYIKGGTLVFPMISPSVITNFGPFSHVPDRDTDLYATLLGGLEFGPRI